MATPVYCCGFECGALINGGHLQDNVGTPTFSTTTIRSGLRSLRCNPAAAVKDVLVTLTSASLTQVGRVYVYFATLPDADCALWSYGSSASTPSANVRFKQSDSKIYAAVSTTLGASGVSVTTGQWYRIDYKALVSTTVADTMDVEVDGVACGQASATTAQGSAATCLLGTITSCTADVFFDDWWMSQTAADYPYGAGHVNSYIPNADGTHNVAGASDFERSGTGTDITNATTDAYQLIDDRPLPTTAVDWIQGTAPPNATDYVEWQYEDESTETAAPRAVEAIVAYHGASAASNNWTVTLREHAGGTSANIFSGAETAPTAVNSKRAHFATVPGTANAWGLTEFNALRSRFLVSDAAPDPQIDAAMLEAEYEDAAGGFTGTIVSTLQKATAALVGSQPFRGTIASALQKATALLSGRMQPKGSIASTMRAATSALVGTHKQSGAIASTMRPATAALAGTQKQAGAIASSMRPATAALSGYMEPSGSIASTMQRLAAALAGIHKQTGAIASTMRPSTAALAGTQAGAPTGTIASTMQRATSALAGTQKYTGTIASSLQKATASLSGYMKPSGAIVATMRPATAAATGLMGAASGAIASSLQRATASLSGIEHPRGSIAATMTRATAALAGSQKYSGSIASTMQRATSALSGVQHPKGAIASTMRAATSALSGAAGATAGAIASTMQKATSTLSGVMHPKGSIASTMQNATASLQGTQTAAANAGTIAASLQKATATLSGTHKQAGAIAATMQITTAALSGKQGQTGTITATMQMLTVALFGSQVYTGTIAATLQALQASASDLPVTKRIVNLDGSYVPITDMVASVLMAVLEGSYVSVTSIDGSVLHPVIDGSYVAIQELEGSR